MERGLIIDGHVVVVALHELILVVGEHIIIGVEGVGAVVIDVHQAAAFGESVHAEVADAAWQDESLHGESPERPAEVRLAAFDGSHDVFLRDRFPRLGVDYGASDALRELQHIADTACGDGFHFAFSVLGEGERRSLILHVECPAGYPNFGANLDELRIDRLVGVVEEVSHVAVSVPVLHRFAVEVGGRGDVDGDAFAKDERHGPVADEGPSLVALHRKRTVLLHRDSLLSIVVAAIDGVVLLRIEVDRAVLDGQVAVLLQVERLVVDAVHLEDSPFAVAFDGEVAPDEFVIAQLVVPLSAGGERGTFRQLAGSLHEERPHGTGVFGDATLDGDIVEREGQRGAVVAHRACDARSCDVFCVGRSDSHAGYLQVIILIVGHRPRRYQHGQQDEGRTHQLF